MYIVQVDGLELIKVVNAARFHARNLREQAALPLKIGATVRQGWHDEARCLEDLCDKLDKEIDNASRSPRS